jgi:hypothetical protein
MELKIRTHLKKGKDVIVKDSVEEKNEEKEEV